MSEVLIKTLTPVSWIQSLTGEDLERYLALKRKIEDFGNPLILDEAEEEEFEALRVLFG